jgi:hypothetical protein
MKQQLDSMTAAVEQLIVSSHEPAGDSSDATIQDCPLSICPPNVSPEHDGYAIARRTVQYQ